MSHSVPNFVRHPPEDKLRHAAQPHLVIVGHAQVVCAVAPRVRQLVLKLIVSFNWGDADVQSDIVVAFAEHVQEGVCSIDHGKGSLGAWPRWNDCVPSSPIVFFKPKHKLCVGGSDDSASLSCELDFEGGSCLTQKVVRIDHEMGFGGETVMGQSSPVTLRFHENDNLVVVFFVRVSCLIFSVQIRDLARGQLGSQGSLTRGFCRLPRESLG